MKVEKKLNWKQGLLILGLIWLICALIDRLWLMLDNRVPGWDPAEYLNGSVLYWRALQNPDWLNGEWWRSFWLLSTKIPPLTYIMTAPFFSIFGLSIDSGTLVMLVFSIMLFVSVYGLGVILFDVYVGLWAAVLCVLIPGLYVYRLIFLLDYPLTGIVIFAYFLLTLWYFNDKPASFQGWIKAIAFGLAIGLSFLVKQPALFFVFLPIVWAAGRILWQKQWLKFSQLIVGLLSSLLVFYPWYRTNWLLTLTAGKRATIDSAILEGDPPLTSIDAWTFYGKVIPYFLSWPLLLVPIVGFLLCWFYWRKPIYSPNPSLSLEDSQQEYFQGNKIIESPWIWLGIYLVGGYLLSSLNMNKHDRYSLPLYPVISIILAVGLLSWRSRWRDYIRYGTVALATLLMLFNLFPLGGGFIANAFSPKMQHHPYREGIWPHQEIIEEILQTSPYLQTTIGVLPSTPELNQDNISFYGGKFDRQVIGRQVGIREKEIEQDRGSLDWFITKTGYQGPVPKVQAKIVEQVENGDDFTVQKTWSLPDDSTLTLHRRNQLSVEVNTLAETREKVQLDEIIIPDIVPPGYPVPVTYKWSGPWQELQQGLLLLTWSHENNSSDNKWLHDHGIGMGALHSGNITQEQENKSFQVIERTAMLPDANLEPGTYTLTATYLNRDTGETYDIADSPVTIQLDDSAPPQVAPELDLLTQLRTTTKQLGMGISGLENIFELITRINQYQIDHDYIRQTDKTLSYRLQAEENLNWVYTLTIARVLQQDIKGSISALEKAIDLEPNNPFHHAYLAFIYLYDWQPNNAQLFLNQAIKLDPNVPEFHTLNGIAALMRGNLVKAMRSI